MAIISVVCEKNPQDPLQKNKRDNGPLMRCFLSRRVKLEKNIPVVRRCSHSSPQCSRSSLRSWIIREMTANNILASLKSTKCWHKLQYYWKSFQTSRKDEICKTLYRIKKVLQGQISRRNTQDKHITKRRWQGREVFQKGLLILSSSTCKGVISGC